MSKINQTLKISSEQTLKIVNTLNLYFSKRNWVHKVDYEEIVNKILKNDKTIEQQNTIAD